MKYQEVAIADALAKPGPACTLTRILLSAVVVADEQGILVYASLDGGRL